MFFLNLEINNIKALLSLYTFCKKHFNIDINLFFYLFSFKKITINYEIFFWNLFKINNFNNYFFFINNLYIFKQKTQNHVNHNLLIQRLSIKNTIISNYFVRYNDLSFLKNISFYENFLFFFLRKNKIFNKGRYSRNRQTYRTGVYWCLILNILALFGLYFYFYRFLFNFSYIWWFFYIFISSFFFSKLIKYNLYNYLNLYLSFNKTIMWYFNFLYMLLRR